MAQQIILATKDSYINSAAQSANYNANHYCLFGRQSADNTYFRTLLFFDLSSLEGKRFKTAIMQVYQTSDELTKQTFGAYSILQDWDENTVTYSNQPDHSTEVFQSLSLAGTSSAGIWCDLDVTALIQDIVYNRKTYYGLKLIQIGTTQYARKNISSKESSGHEPRLIVDVTGGFNVKVGGTVKNADVYTKVAGVVMPCDVYTKEGGVLKQGE